MTREASRDQERRADIPPVALLAASAQAAEAAHSEAGHGLPRGSAAARQQAGGRGLSFRQAAGSAALFVVDATLLLAPGSSARVNSGGVIAFERVGCRYDDPGETCFSGIWSVNVDGGAARLLSRKPAGEGASPSWSPNGRRIAFEDVCDIWSMRADGSDQRLLAPAGGRCYGEPAWSPRGTKIAYSDMGSKRSTPMARAVSALPTVRRTSTPSGRRTDVSLRS